jgi:PKD repeat protein
VYKGTTVLFNGTQSSSEGDNTTYTWAFLDGTQQTLTGATAYYTFNNPGVFNVTLTVQDSIGIGTAQTVVTVSNETRNPPTITISGVPSGQVIPPGTIITFGVDNSTLRNVPVVSYTWNMGDNKTSDQGQPLSIITTTVPTEAYAYLAGIYNVTLTVLYSDGLSDFSNITIAVGQSSASTTPTPTSSQSPGSTYDSSSTSATPSTNIASDNSSLALPPIILAIITGVTIFVLFGSIFWLRKTNKTLSE